MSNASIEENRLRYIAKTAQISYYPIAFVRGEGALLFDADGKRYIDFLSSASSANLGHGNKRIAQAVYDQMSQLAQYTFAYFNQEPATRLAEMLTSLVPSDAPMQVLFSTTGSAAIDSAIKLVRGATGRQKIISMYEAYHGSTYGSLSLSALSLNMRRKIGPLLPEVYHFHYPTADRPWQECIAEMEYAFKKYLPPEEVAAIFVEPIAGDMGLVTPPKEWLKALRDICDRYGILLVSDEIQLALCRTGRWFAIEHFDVRPDLYVLGKALGGGLPVGAVIGPEKIMSSLEAPAHVFTLAASNATMAAAIENLTILKEMDANTVSEQKGDYLRKALESLRDEYPDLIGDIRGFGLSLGVDIIDKEAKANPRAATSICYSALKDGLVVIFLNQSTLRMQPPLVITYEEIDEAVQILREALRKTSAGEISAAEIEQVKGW